MKIYKKNCSLQKKYANFKICRKTKLPNSKRVIKKKPDSRMSSMTQLAMAHAAHNTHDAIGCTPMLVENRSEAMMQLIFFK